jgi:transcription elongation GreA/GreB family factor
LHWNDEKEEGRPAPATDRLARRRKPCLASRVDKSALLQAIVARLEAELALQTEAAHASRTEATDADSRAEGKFDMRGQSAAYLASGQAKLATEIAEAITAYQALPRRRFERSEAVAVGALVTLEARGSSSLYFLGPTRGGLDLELGGVSVTVITVHSSLGRSLLGRRVGDTITLPARAGPSLHTLTQLE